MSAPRFYTHEDMHGTYTVRTIAGCTGHMRATIRTDAGLPDVLVFAVEHDGETCPVHEAGEVDDAPNGTA
jgi:hypothetical protein